jgi:hypothetical protein
MARYIALIYASPQYADPASAEWQAEMAEHGAFAAAAGAAGVLVGGEALQAPVTATTVSIPAGKGGEVLTADGPYAETKEVLSGFYILQCADLDEALHWASQIPDASHGGKVEVRPVMEFDQG